MGVVVVAHEVRDSYIRGGGRLIAAAGVDGLTIVETADAVSVASRDGLQSIKDVVAKIGARGRRKASAVNRNTGPGGMLRYLWRAGI